MMKTELNRQQKTQFIAKYISNACFNNCPHPVLLHHNSNRRLDLFEKFKLTVTFLPLVTYPTLFFFNETKANKSAAKFNSAADVKSRHHVPVLRAANSARAWPQSAITVCNEGCVVSL